MSQNTAYLDDFLSELRGLKKTAGVKAAEPLSEPGGYMGKSTHPSAQADDSLITSRTGSRFSENSSDVKDNREKPSVDATADASASSGEGTPKQDEHQLNIGTEQSSTGADSTHEDAYKGNKDDPGTSHPMKADDGQKYAAYRAMPFGKLAAHFVSRRDSILAKFANGSTTKQALTIQHAGQGVTQKVLPQAPAPVAAPPAPALAPKQAELQNAAAAGYQLAAALGTPDGQLRKRAEAMIEATVKEADLKADLVAQHLELYAQMLKRAEDPQEGLPPEPAGGPPPGGPGGPGGGPPGPPPGDPAQGLPPEAAAGGAPGAGGDAGGNPEATLHELAAALLEMGIDPAQLAAAAEQLKSQAGGSPEKVAAAQAWGKAAGEVARLKRSGRFRFGEPKTAQLDALRQDLKAHINELMKYSA